MNVLIVYATKYGFTEKCVKALANKLYGKVNIINIQQEVIKDISSYNTIIIGGPIYAGRLPKKLRRFLVDNTQILLDKKIGLFVACSMSGENALKQLNDVFPNELCNKAVVKEGFGGEINKDKVSLFYRLIVKMVSKADNSATTRNNGIISENINRFAGIINNCK
ncbi:flavodoxin [Vallitalea longa]|uniref:Flavodoxin n=1 Tax=Vallitalea longa TaxID=2936439 RepID=A0A9W5Y9P3_9FIRM|nr:flavodoxin domain-containing protein [Vallitalea longa]GKX29872.1 flavodoxin [Vallitalea longa]